MTTSYALEKFAKRLFYPSEFLGVFTINTLPNGVGLFTNTTKTTLIVTIDSRWVAIVIRGDEAYYFDPLVYDPPLIMIIWMHSCNQIWTCNQRQVLPSDSLQCGYLCLHFLHSIRHSFFDDIDIKNTVNLIYPKLLNYNDDYDAMIDKFISEVKILCKYDSIH